MLETVFKSCKQLTIVFVMLCLLSGLSATSLAQTQAEVDSFQLGKEYVDRLEEFYSASGFKADRKQLVKQSINIKLMALEASQIGLKTVKIKTGSWDYDIRSSTDLELITDLSMSEAYRSHVLQEYSVPENVIKSYYRANPAKFRKGPGDDAELLPLDEKLSQKIESFVISQAKDRIMQEKLAELKDKYSVSVANK